MISSYKYWVYRTKYPKIKFNNFHPMIKMKDYNIKLLSCKWKNLRIFIKG